MADGTGNKEVLEACKRTQLMLVQERAKREEREKNAQVKFEEIVHAQWGLQSAMVAMQQQLQTIANQLHMMNKDNSILGESPMAANMEKGFTSHQGDSIINIEGSEQTGSISVGECIKLQHDDEISLEKLTEMEVNEVVAKVFDKIPVTEFEKLKEGRRQVEVFDKMLFKGIRELRIIGIEKLNVKEGNTKRWNRILGKTSFLYKCGRVELSFIIDPGGSIACKLKLMLRNAFCFEKIIQLIVIGNHGFAREIRFTQMVHVSSYEIDKIFGSVELSNHKYGVLLCALSCTIFKNIMDVEDVRGEVEIMKRMTKHPNIVMLKHTYEDDSAVHIVMLCEEGELFDRIVARCHYTEEELQVVLGSKVDARAMLCSYVRWGRHKAMLSFYSALQERGIIFSVADFNFMMSPWQRKSLQIDEKKYATMAQFHFKLGNFEKVLDIMELMESNNIQYSILSFTMLLQCDIGKWDIASPEATCHAIYKTEHPDDISCKALLKLYLRVGLSEKAKVFVTQIKKDQIEVNEEFLVTFMKVYCKGGMVREVEQLIEELCESYPMVGNSIVNTFLIVMKRQNIRSTEGESGFEHLDQSEVVAIELVLMHCLAARNETRMKEKLELLLGTNIGNIVANRLISQVTKEGDILSTKYLYEITTKHGYELEDFAIASIISLYGKHKPLKQAQEVFATMADYGTPGRVLHSIIVKALTSCGKYNEVEEALRNSFHENLELDTVVYNTYIKAILEAGKLWFAISIYERMFPSNISPSAQKYNTMISVYGRARNLVKVVEMFNMAQRMGVVLDGKMYTNVICYYGKFGKVDEASAIFSKMQEEGIKLGQVRHNIVMNVTVAARLYSEAQKSWIACVIWILLIQGVINQLEFNLTFKYVFAWDFCAKTFLQVGNYVCSTPVGADKEGFTHVKIESPKFDLCGQGSENPGDNVMIITIGASLNEDRMMKGVDYLITAVHRRIREWKFKRGDVVLAEQLSGDRGQVAHCEERERYAKYNSAEFVRNVFLLSFC